MKEKKIKLTVQRRSASTVPSKGSHIYMEDCVTDTMKLRALPAKAQPLVGKNIKVKIPYT
jgi:hypothetical protein